MNSLVSIIGDLEIRLRRLEQQIGSATDELLQFMSVEEDVGVSETIYIYKRDVNDSFLIGTSKVGVDRIGDRRSQQELLYSG